MNKRRFTYSTNSILLLLALLIFCSTLQIKVLAQTTESTAPEVLEIPKPEVSVFFHLGDKLVSAWLAFLNWLGRTCDPVIRPVFSPINSFLAKIYQPWAKICALGLFIGTMLWVWFGMSEEYVNRGRSKKSIWTDLRFWTIIAMLPHIFVYFYF
ncbi:MAG TPA: hypothetical protein PLX23_07475 [Candidatus Hydrogenedens sp.]|nr:hypothetical protein [Candidatus Hydrogenedens sp.]